MVNAKITTLPDSNFVYLCIEVADTGIGIAKEELNSIFKNYYQTKRGYNVNGSGWGIGLSLVKRLVENRLIKARVNQAQSKTVSKPVTSAIPVVDDPTLQTWIKSISREINQFARNSNWENFYKIN